VAQEHSSVSADPLGQSAQFLKGVGPVRQEQLRRLGIETARDLLFHFPRHYDDLSDIRRIADLAEGSLQTVQGEVVEIEGKQVSDGRTVVSVVLSDGGRNCLEGVWFNQSYAARQFRFGLRVAFSGKPKWYRDHWQMACPRVRVLDQSAGRTTGDEGSSLVVPVYPLTEDLRAEHLRPILRRLVDECAHVVQEILPVELRRAHGLPGVAEALRAVHFPTNLLEAEAARGRFVYEQFLVLQLALALRRREIRDRQRAPVLATTGLIDARIRRLLPFRLTGDQEKAVAAISKDLAGERPMQRLLQADVGAGKTAVAVYALLVTVANKHQAALMAPTEVLARQHWQTLEGYLAASRVRRLLLTGALSSRQRRQALEDIAEGRIDLVVGTQALVQEDVRFARLGLVVIDEQHKFGVTQRARVRRLGVDPHYLVMTATPIPRTVALTVFGDLDSTVIRQLPPGRQPVATRWVTDKHRAGVYEQVANQLRQGRQGFVVCPLVEESDALGIKGAEEAYKGLAGEVFRAFRVGLLHGRLDDAAKEAVMERFRNRELDLLVCTVVVEVGVDVPNATVMVIEHAERFGLSQLHQLRGRIARGTTAGMCYLFGDPATDEAKDRLRTLTRTSDGFALAEHDARLRGVGEFFGTRQHGVGEVAAEQLVAEKKLLLAARQDALAMVARDAGLRLPDHAGLRRAVLERYGKKLELAEVG
jgi:ATP-dependent DNA helicase RecG